MKTRENPYQAEVPQAATPEQKARHSVERLNTAALEGESFEDAAEALQNVEALQNFRRKVSQLPFASFHEIVEEMTNLNKLAISAEEKISQTEVLATTLEQSAARLSPRVADLYLAILAKIQKAKYEPKYDITREKITDLDQSGDLNVLLSGGTSWEIKLNRIETRLDDGINGYLSGLRALDRREGKEMDDDLRQWRIEEIEKLPKTPGDDSDESEPGVDPMERKKEGEPTTAIWETRSAYDGYCKYFREKAFSKWDAVRNRWVGEYQYHTAKIIPLSGNTNENKEHIDLVTKAVVSAGKRIRIPIPYTHNFSKAEVARRKFSVQENQDGDVSIFIEGDGSTEVKIYLSPHMDKKFTSDLTAINVPEMTAEFSQETNSKLEDIKAKKRGNIARALTIASYVRKRIKYLAPKDRTESERYNSAYRNHPNGLAGAVDEIKEGDCDVVNTYFSALCSKLGIPTRHVVGHSVDEDEQGNIITHFGTGHAWSEVWDEVKKEWMMIDATPPGDPNLEKPEMEPKQKKHRPGPFGGQETVMPSDEWLEELRKKLAEHKEKLSYTKEERQLAEGADVELKEARQIVKEISEAEKTRLPNGELVVDALAKLFNAIVESRKSMAPVYEGPVRRREGGERIEDIVRHKIGMMASETDPLSREKLEEEAKEEKIIGGFDLYMIGDKSGSMQATAEDSEHLWQMQRRAMYLIFSSLHRFERNIERTGLVKENALSVRTQSLSFRGESTEEIDLDKPLSSQFSAQDKVNLWHSLTEQGSGNGDVTALAVIYEQIKKEVAEVEKSGAKDNRLRLIIACSDGGYVGAEGQMRALAEELAKLKVIVVGMGLTETAASVPVVMHNPPHSRGDIARDVNDLPALVAKHIVLEALKLFPQKAAESARQIIESSIAKFKNLG